MYCFKQLPSNFTLDLLPTKFNAGERILSSVAGGVITYQKIL